ncbi:MAG: bacitracin transport permease protein BcrB [Bacilli bacterium]|nr:bacitracin transport permease protein BcrB [Bacilli bacterium]
MLEFIRIFQNEWIKLIRRRRFVIVLLLGLALIGFYTYARYHESENQKHYNSPAVQAQMMDQQIKRVEQDLQTGTDLTAEQKAAMQKQITNMKEKKASLLSGNMDAANRITKEEIQQNINQLNKSISALTPDQAQQKGQMQVQLKINEYQLNHLPQNRDYATTTWKAIQDFLEVGTQLFIPLLCVLLVADMVSGEQTGGTIKLLLTRPASRGKILFAKYVTAIIGAICINLVLFAVLTGGLVALFGTKGDTNPAVVGVKYQQANVVKEDGTVGNALVPDAANAKVITMKSFAIQSMLLTLIASVGMCTLGFFCSVLVRSAAVSTGISMAVIIIGTIIMHALKGAAWLKYFLTPHFDLPDVWTGSLSQQFGFPMGLAQSLIILAVWTIGLYAIGHYIFTKRDILA